VNSVASPVRAKRKTKVGRVVSDKMDKTIVVSVERLTRHRLYKRVIRLTTRFKAHDERNEAHVGDTVLIEESRPLSATKRWRLVTIVRRAGEGSGEPVVAEEAETTEAIHRPRRPAEDVPATVLAPEVGAGAGDAAPAAKVAEAAEAAEAVEQRPAAEAAAEAPAPDASSPEVEA
jgi:small subunit ribosomal protein S17